MPQAWLEILARLGLALVAGGIIGLNRDLHHKQAGVRTNALVSLGAALAVLVVLPPNADDTHRIDSLSRVIQGVLTGIGFLGAGVILRNPTSGRVSGLTTAAAIWLAALLGIACGAGYYAIACVALVLALCAIVCGRPIERWFESLWPRSEKPPKPDAADG